MARDTQSSPAGEKKLEQYGIWVKVKPREVVPVEAPEDSFELSDLDTSRADAAASEASEQSSLTAEEEKLLDELETELGPEKEMKDALVPDEEPLLDDEGGLPDIENMTEEADESGLSEEELPELEEEPLTPPRRASGRKPAPREVEVTLTETSDKEQFDDLEALESELASVTTTARAGSPSSAEILSRIEEELRSIRTDLTQLRGELTGLRKNAGAPAASTPATGAETQSGFFDEDEDETIALTGDELDNILNTADIMEEVSESPSVESGDGTTDAEIAPPLDDILSFDTPELEDDKNSAAGEEGLVLSEDSLLPQEDASLEELPAEMILDDLDELEAPPSAKKTGGADLEDLPELDLEGIPEIEAENPAPAFKPTASRPVHTDAGDETIDLETLDIGEEPTVIQAVPAQVDALDELSDDVDLEALAAEAEELEGNTPPTETEDLEIAELEAVGDEPGAGKGETEIEIDFESDQNLASESELEELSSADLGSAEEILEAEEVGKEPLAAAPSGSGVPDNLKDEIRTVLKYMDNLLEALPDEKIQEFASSDYFVMYKKLFEDLGLGE